MRTTVIAMLHQGHPSATKMDKLAAAFWWPGIFPEIREKAENCPSCRASGKNLITQLPYTEKKQTKTFVRTKSRNSNGLRWSNKIKDSR